MISASIFPVPTLLISIVLWFLDDTDQDNSVQNRIETVEIVWFYSFCSYSLVAYYSASSLLKRLCMAWQFYCVLWSRVIPFVECLFENGLFHSCMSSVFLWIFRGHSSTSWTELFLSQDIFLNWRHWGKTHLEPVVYVMSVCLVGCLSVRPSVCPFRNSNFMGSFANWSR